MNHKFPIGISLFEAKGDHYKNLFELIIRNVQWDFRIKSRLTASYGTPYNYSDISYPFVEVPLFIDLIFKDLTSMLGYNPNNCLINYYNHGNSSMGFHSDRTDVLEPATGITILSLGNERIMRFKHKTTKKTFDVAMEPNRFLHMTSKIQDEWLHAILPSNPLSNESERISLTFRKLIA